MMAIRASRIACATQEGRAIATTTTRKRAAAAAGSKPKAATKTKPDARKKAAPASKTKAVAAKKTASAAPKKAKSPKAAAKTAPRKTGIPADVLKLQKLILKSLDDDKAEEIVSIDLTGKSSIADFLVIASGRSSRQVGAIAEHLVERIAQATGRKVKAEGKSAGDWVLIDTGDIIVHIFRPEVRSFYNLEKMWGAAIPEPAAA
ncbi:MAG TPA: ribosome silencing factor [Ferrovibrio sp.]|jgi:ribosome-associated protein|uniref:ribosome silencing factor n=1 Tax=Ferrovibrio sp. TaxID=1917215 RepID=UPI002ED01E7B